MSLRTARRIAQLTQDELAQRAGVDEAFICQLETGTRDITQITYENVCRIAWALNVTPEELFPMDQFWKDRPAAVEPEAAAGGRT